MTSDDISGTPVPAKGAASSETPFPNTSKDGGLIINVGASGNTGGAEKPPKSFFDRIKEYRELIAVAAAFLGGVAWLHAAFATKAHVAGIRCLLGSTIERVDSESRSRVLQSEIISFSTKLQQSSLDLTKAQTAGQPTVFLMREVEELKAQIDDSKKRKSKFDDAAAAADQRLQKGECSQ